MVSIAKGTWWRQIRRTVATEIFNAVASASDWWVLVGQDGSGNPIAWRILKSSATGYPIFYSGQPTGSVPLNDVDFLSNESIVFAVGDTGRIYESSNLGQSWTNYGLSPANDIDGVVCVAADPNSNVIAVGNGAIWGRDTLKTFTTRWTGSQQWKSVAYRPGAGWVVVGNSGWVTQSPSGINGTFIAPYQITTQNFKRIRTNDTYFMAVGSFGDVWRSPTGLPGSWLKLDLGTSDVFFVGTALYYATAGWVAATYDGEFWYTSNNGDSWTKGDFVFPDAVRNCDAVFESALMVGDYGTAYVSFDDSQTDYVEPDDITGQGEVGPAFSENNDMAGDAVRRLVTQFRSGRG